MNRSEMCVYLAGPMTGCNLNQKIHWRREMRRRLEVMGYRVSDPTEETARQGAYAVTADIAECDVVIANLWKESIGTVLGIVQARRSNIPVILIDQNYIDSPVLAELVDQIVRDGDAALNALEELMKRLAKAIIVKKKDGSANTFSPQKLSLSIRSALQGGCDDSVFISGLLKEVSKRVFRSAKASENIIDTSHIKSIIFETLSGFTADRHGRHVAKAVTILCEKWGDFELKKGDNAAYDELIRLVDEANEAREMAELECANIRAIAEYSGAPLDIRASTAVDASSFNLRLGDPVSLEEFFSVTKPSSESVVVRSSAKKSFRDVPYTDYLRMTRALSLLRDDFLISKVGSDQREKLAAWDRFKSGLIQERLTHGLSATQTGRGQNINQHTVKAADGRILKCEKIRDIGRTYDRQKFLCVYFAWDEVECKLHIKGFDHGQTVNDHT